jgi:hypothetical protein
MAKKVAPFFVNPLRPIAIFFADIAENRRECSLWQKQNSTIFVSL